MISTSHVALAFRVMLAADALFTWLSKRMKKTKGAILPQVMAQAFKSMEGWSVRPVRAVSVPDGGGFWALPVLQSRYAPAIAPYSFFEEDASKLKAMRDEILSKATIVKGKIKPGTLTNDEVGHLYITAPSPVEKMSFREAYSFTIDKAWVVVPGWQVTAPNSDTVVIVRKMSYTGQLDPENEVTSDSFWKWAYAHGLDEDAKRLLDEMYEDGAAKAQANAGERKKMEERRTFVPAVEKLFRTITEDTKQALVASLTKMLKSQFQTMLDWYESRPPWTPGRDPFRNQSVFRDMVIDIDYGRKVVRAKADAAERIQKLAQEQAKAIQDTFVHKNTTKLSSIVSAKGLSLMETPKILRIDAGATSLEGEILFKFKDGSRFTVRNKAVWKMSALGNEFAQFPTTFHDVVLPQGKKMAQPSEQRMLDVFARA